MSSPIPVFGGIAHGQFFENVGLTVEASESEEGPMTIYTLMQFTCREANGAELMTLFAYVTGEPPMGHEVAAAVASMTPGVVH